MQQREIASEVRPPAVEGQEGPKELIEFVCMSKHRSDPLNAKGYAVAAHQQLWAYCARGAEVNHEWIRVPATPLDEVTIGRMEERPPAPRVASRT
jgi:hypothetical protein